MSEDRFDVIVVGGGLAGSAAAYTLAKAGVEVAIDIRIGYRAGQQLRQQEHDRRQALRTQPEKAHPGF